MFHLIVTSPFGDHAVGSRITDADEVAKVLGSENFHHVVKVAATPHEEAPPAPPPAPSPPSPSVAPPAPPKPEA